MHREAIGPLSLPTTVPGTPDTITRPARYRAKIDSASPTSRRETFQQHEGTEVMVYPGSFSTLAEIAAGQHPDAPQELRDPTVVSLHLRGR